MSDALEHIFVSPPDKEGHSFQGEQPEVPAASPEVYKEVIESNIASEQVIQVLAADEVKKQALVVDQVETIEPKGKTFPEKEELLTILLSVTDYSDQNLHALAVQRWYT